MKRFFAIALVCLLILTLATGCSTKGEGTLRMEVKEIVASGNDHILTVNIQNDTGFAISYGWVDSCLFEVTTSTGKYFCDAPFMGRIQRGTSTQTISLSNCPGTVNTIVITELCQLDHDGLPGKELHDLTLYNTQAGVTFLEDSFGFFDDPHWFTEVLRKFAPVIVVLAVLAKILLFFFGKKRRTRYANRDFTTNNMHDQMTQMANDAHTQEVNRQFHEDIHRHTQEALDISNKSVTSIDQGGFTPPPEPPTFF